MSRFINGLAVNFFKARMQKWITFQEKCVEKMEDHIFETTLVKMEPVSGPCLRIYQEMMEELSPNYFYTTKTIVP